MLSQVVHLPLNWALGLLGHTRGLGLLPLPLLALALGLSAGLCEEVARYLMLRFGLRRARSFREAVQFGVGHGGMEAIILGTIAALPLAAMLAARGLPLGGRATEWVAAVEAAFWGRAWYIPAVGGLERIFAITAHVAMSVMVMRAVTRRRVGWLLAAIGAHTALDAFAVWGSSRLGLAATEAGIAAAAILFAWAIWAMRDGAPAMPAAQAPDQRAP